jgi:hypothetical protein
MTRCQRASGTNQSIENGEGGFRYDCSMVAKNRHRTRRSESSRICNPTCLIRWKLIGSLFEVSVLCRDSVGKRICETAFALPYNSLVLNQLSACGVNALLGAPVTEKHLRQLCFRLVWNFFDKRFDAIRDRCHYAARQ